MKFLPLAVLAAALPAAAQTNADPSPDPSALMPVVQTVPPGTNAEAAEPAPADSGPPARMPLPDPFADSLIRQVVVRHEKAVAGDKKETKALTADLERWTKEEPSNYLLLAYLGSAYTLGSRDSWPGPGKLSLLRKGGQALDAAVTGDPTNPAVRFVRAIDYYELPSLFGKHQTAHDDFQYLVQQLNGVLPMPYSLSDDTVQAIYYYAGLSDLQFDQKDDARDLFRRGVKLGPKSPLAGKMRAELARLP